ncbi:MAG: Rne/Rng family ribonuclease [Candidatus Pacebacteria bacterium]|nr:Rne/Rng family ribonuclease [Candidatus Paceibacterota bacterium]
MKQLLINEEDLETRVAVAEDGRLQDYFVERKDEEHLVGSIYKAVVRNLEPSLQAAFVDIGAEKNAFLHYWDMLPATEEMLEETEGESFPQDDTVDNKPSGGAANTKGGGMLSSLKRRLLKLQKSKAQSDDSPQNSSKKPQFDVEDIPQLFPVKSEVLVQVTKGPIGNKGARVTTHLSIPGRYLVFLPNSSHIGVSKRIDSQKERQRIRQIIRKVGLPKGTGVICRTAAAGKKEKQFRQELDLLLSAWREAQKRIDTERAPCCVYHEPGLDERALRDNLSEDVQEIVTDSESTHEMALELARKSRRDNRVKVRLYRGARPIFEKYKIADQVENIFQRRVELPSGGYICIDETEALIAIDVNTGKSRGGKDHPETILNTNMEAVDEIARQLRLRNLGGLLVLDLIDMRARQDRQTVYKALKDALAVDRARTKTCPISPLGLVEMTRQREYESLQETIFSECPYCGGKGLVKSPLSMSVEIMRRLQTILRRTRKGQIRVTVHPHVLERLKNEDATLLRRMEDDLGGELSFRADPELHLEEFRIFDLASGKEL